jgi:hypothetical protein
MIPKVFSSEQPDFISFSLAKLKAANLSKLGISGLDNFLSVNQGK